MEKIELMHSVYGKREYGKCFDCHFCHWKIIKIGDEKKMGPVWCEVYGRDKTNTLDTQWSVSFPACGIFNLSHDPKKRNIYKLANSDAGEQLSLF